MSDYQQQASFYRAALLLGLVSGDAVIAWADEIIARDSEAPSALFDLAMVPANDLSELRHGLQPISAPGESDAIIRALFDMVRRDLAAGERDVKDSITVLAQARHFLKLPTEYFDAIDTLQDDHMLATAGVTGGVAATEVRVVTWLAQFAGSELSFLEETARS